MKRSVGRFEFGILDYSRVGVIELLVSGAAFHAGFLLMRTYIAGPEGGGGGGMSLMHEDRSRGSVLARTIAKSECT